MLVEVKEAYESDGYNTCMGCGLAVYPGELIHDKPGWGYPSKFHPSYGKTEIICTRCAEVVKAIDHSVYCARCINPCKDDKPHVWDCPQRREVN